MKYYVASFASTTLADDCRVWGYGVSEIGSNKIEIGTTIDEFMKWCESLTGSPKIYFHDLKWDSQFIFSWLFRNDFMHVSKDERATRTFTTLISDKNLYYSIEVIFKLRGKTTQKVTFLDSSKLIPLSIKEMSKAFDLPAQIIEIDSDSHNYLPEGSPLTDQERKYFVNNIKIISDAISFFHDQGLNRMTISSCAMDEFKNIIGGKKIFDRYFPAHQNCNRDTKQAYKGGWSYLVPEFAGKTINKNGIVFDMNSIFPHAMESEKMPCGTPIFFYGEYKPDPLYPLYITQFRCSFDLKKGKLPTVQVRDDLSLFQPTEYLTTSGEEEVVLCMTSVDYELFREQYEVYNIEFFAGWKFRDTTKIFKPYVEKWGNNKIRAKEEKNAGLYTLSKLFLVSLYGKFGTSLIMREKIPYLESDDGAVKYYDSPAIEKDGVYMPVAAFVTSYARKYTISAAQRITDDYNAGKSTVQFVYADTDSLHCISDDFEIPEWLDIDDSRIGAWKIESVFNKAKYLRAKCYIENSTKDFGVDDPEYNLKVTVAGMPEECYSEVTFRNFKIGATYTGKKMPKLVKGGVILETIDFSIKK